MVGPNPMTGVLISREDTQTETHRGGRRVRLEQKPERWGSKPTNAEGCQQFPPLGKARKDLS